MGSSGNPGLVDGSGSVVRMNPISVDIDSGQNIYVAELTNNVIRKVTSSGEVSTFAGSISGNFDGTVSVARFIQPAGLCFAPNSDIYVMDYGNCRVRKISSVGIVTTVAGSVVGYADGMGTNTRFQHPFRCAVDSAGNVFITDEYGYRIRKMTPSGEATINGKMTS